MIVVDSSVWIAQLRGADSMPVQKLEGIKEPDRILVGDVTLLEVLQGARHETHAARIEQNLRQFRIERMLDDGSAVRATRNFSRLRERGITVRKTIDLIIATFCIDHGHVLLHDDRDFDPMAAHLGSQIV